MNEKNARTVLRFANPGHADLALFLKEVQNAKAALDAAENEVRSAEVALAPCPWLPRRTLEVGDLLVRLAENAQAVASGFQRKVGPGQYVGGNTSDPVFIIGDLDTVWVLAYIRETEAPNVHIGETIYFTVLAYPERAFPANLSYVAAAFDPSIHRLLVRATVNNSEGLFKPEMFATVKILTGEGDAALAISSDAVIYEGDSTARVWVVRDEGKAIELRRIKVGLTNGNMVEVSQGLASNDRVITRGSLFIDRVARAGS